MAGELGGCEVRVSVRVAPASLSGAGVVRCSRQAPVATSAHGPTSYMTVSVALENSVVENSEATTLRLEHQNKEEQPAYRVLLISLVGVIGTLG